MDVSIFNKWAKALPIIVNDELKKAEIMIDPYVQDHLQGQKFRPGIRASIKSKRLYGGKNPTDKLYSQTGDLLKALSSATENGKDGKIFSVTTNNGVVTLLKGVDVSIIKYARIHEYGGTTGRNGATKLPPRPYLNPAMKEFVKEEMDGVLERIVERLLKV